MHVYHRCFKWCAFTSVVFLMVCTPGLCTGDVTGGRRTPSSSPAGQSEGPQCWRISTWGRGLWWSTRGLWRRPLRQNGESNQTKTPQSHSARSNSPKSPSCTLSGVYPHQRALHTLCRTRARDLHVPREVGLLYLSTAYQGVVHSMLHRGTSVTSTTSQGVAHT